MKEKKINDEYFSWLYSKVKRQQRSYLKLSRFLHTILFKWSVANDDNRCEDGLNLRQNFIDENRLDESHLTLRYFMKAPCTVFEVLVALAGRLDFNMYELGNQESQEPRWYREMLMNLRLAEYTDNYNSSERFDEMTEQAIYKVIETFMDRTYAFDGTGGLFPLKRRPKNDQRTVEIWYQMMLYLDENYG